MNADDQKDLSMFHNEWKWISQFSDAALKEVARIVDSEIQDRKEPLNPEDEPYKSDFYERLKSTAQELEAFHKEYNQPF
jgi:hypothetical protein